jgi:hypothetical protein
MAIGSTLNYSAPAVGTTISSVDKILDGTFADGDYFTDANGNDVPLICSVRPCSLGSVNKTVGLTLTFNPSISNVALGADQGKATVTINCSYREGVSVDQALVKTLAGYAMSLFIPSAVQTALFGGSTE